MAGLTCALKLAPLRVADVCKGTLGQYAASDWAQGGVAAAIGIDDSPQLHASDTMLAGAGLSDDAIVDILTDDAPTRIDELLELGASFDRDDDGELVLGREAAHGRRRIVKAGGDATGHEIVKTLIAAVRDSPHIEIIECAAADDLIHNGERVLGIYAHRQPSGAPFAMLARATVLATGGIGRLYLATTNPPQACGDGLAMAARAHALLADCEFVQFHPTALAIGADPMPLVTEAIRGEGATLINDLGERFMPEIHTDAELAPRDVVARAIFEQLRRGRSVGLDATSCVGDAFPRRFPTVFASCMHAGIDPRVQRIPVAPAAHYHMGGVAVNEWGRTSLSGLWACGECSATGVHGANRLASNSLLEALVYGTRVATDILNAENAQSATTLHYERPHGDDDETQAVRDLRNLMYANVGLVRDGRGLHEALLRIETLKLQHPVARTELRNLLVVARLIADAAYLRMESRGSHYRLDFPHADPALAHRSFRRLEPVA